MARLTINFSNKFKDVYDKVIMEDNYSKVICEVLQDYYDNNKNITNEDINNKLDAILDKLENGVIQINEDDNYDVDDLIDSWD